MYFISGHLDITQEEFNTHYIPQIDAVFEEYNTCSPSFHVGDARGVDTMAQQYLKDKIDPHPEYRSCCEWYPKKDVNVCCVGDKPRNFLVGSLRCGFSNDTKKDEYMTYRTMCDILWIRSEEESKKLYGKKYRKRVSGTEKNKLRRLESDNSEYIKWYGVSFGRRNSNGIIELDYFDPDTDEYLGDYYLVDGEMTKIPDE